MNPQRWFQRHSLKLLAIRDTPEAIAGGVAIGIFIGFTPLVGLKTALCILFAWLTRSNILAAVLASAAHDVLVPLMPVIFLWEYDVGSWLLSHPHHWPPPPTWRHGEEHFWRHWIKFFTNWRTFSAIGKPTLVGSLVFAAPFAIISYVFTRRLVARHQRKKKPPTPPVGENPS